MKRIDKKVLIIIAFEDFQDREFYPVYDTLRARGASVYVASIQKGVAVGALGGEVSVDIAFADVDTGEYDAFVLIGGKGAEPLGHNDNLLGLVKDMDDRGKLVSAICIAPVILANSGILVDREATVWNSPENHKLVEILEDNGARFSSDRVVVDDNIITANGPEAAQEFVETVVEYLL